jgi:hypothetical protein
MNLDEIENEIGRLNAEREALKEFGKTSDYKQQRETILKNHPFCKQLRGVLIEALTRDLTVNENELIKTVNTELDQAAEDFDSELRGKTKALQFKDPAVRVDDVDKLVNSVATGEKRNDYSAINTQMDLGQIVKAKILMDRSVKQAKTHICKIIAISTFTLKEGMEDSLIKNLMPRLYDESEFQKLLSATPEQQNTWILKLREGFGLTLGGTVQKQKLLSNDIEKQYQDLMKRKQAYSTGERLDKQFDDLMKKRGAF